MTEQEKLSEDQVTFVSTPEGETVELKAEDEAVTTILEDPETTAALENPEDTAELEEPQDTTVLEEPEEPAAFSTPAEPTTDPLPPQHDPQQPQFSTPAPQATMPPSQPGFGHPMVPAPAPKGVNIGGIILAVILAMLATLGILVVTGIHLNWMYIAIGAPTVLAVLLLIAALVPHSEK
ncbi:hypothetical protein [Boudabousia marimammalium]|uniref:Uncharacterized protein n=1 Tax=Boudabousia marimammalium TaxID=156892 RepID=A0A1Q5PRZ4_9ACTO|nr:hypothetical protein [Boudabousia marimammalium]OKL50358.1 hypothetical protein BM477_02975 [Boudabousia marimammalium]